MGLYENWVLPRLLDLTMRNHVLYSYRRGVMNLATGLVLEIGVGSGRNLPLYGPPVRLVVGLDTSSQSLRLARQQAADRKSTRLNSSHVATSYAVFCLK